MKANKNTKKSWLVYLSMVDISTNFEDKISRGSGENRSGSRAASVAGTGGTLYKILTHCDWMKKKERRGCCSWEQRQRQRRRRKRVQVQLSRDFALGQAHMKVKTAGTSSCLVAIQKQRYGIQPMLSQLESYRTSVTTPVLAPSWRPWHHPAGSHTGRGFAV